MPKVVFAKSNQLHGIFFPTRLTTISPNFHSKGGGSSHRPDHHQFPERKGRGLHEALYESGDQHHDQENSAKEIQCVLLHGPAVL